MRGSRGLFRLGQRSFVLPRWEVSAAAYSGKTVGLWDVTQKTIIEEKHTGGQIKDLAFSDARNLDTDQHIRTLAPHPYPSNAIRETFLPLLHATGEWVIWDRKRVLFLPWDYRPYSSSVNGNILVMGHESGRITFMCFDPMALALDFSNLRSHT